MSDLLENPYAPPTVEARVRRRSRFERERRSVLVAIVLSVVTLGLYQCVWFMLRQPFLDSLDSDKKLGALGRGPLMTAVAFWIISIAAVVVPDAAPLVTPVSIGGGVVMLIASFRVMRILRSNFARTGRSLQVSAIATFLFGTLYLQFKINQAADIPAHRRSKSAKKRASGSRISEDTG